ncbi:MAG: glycosyltransferase, partial [Caldilineaceae bacterium]|nr:glycosyltransferase [Caldilineaceae bacterium]
MTEIRRVALLSYHTCPLARLGGKKTGGMNVYVRDFARALAASGVQVDVFTRMQEECSPRIDHDLGYGARVIHIPAGPVAPISVAAMEDYVDEFAAGILAFAAVEGHQYDVIHSHYWLSGLAGEQMRAAWPGTPLIHMFHTLGHMKNAIAGDVGERASQARLDGETHLVRSVDRLIAATPAERSQLLNLYDADPAAITVIPPGVDLARFQPIEQNEAKHLIGIPGWRKNILFAGRIEPLKGIDTLLGALALLRERHPGELDNVCVTIIGGNPWADTLDEEMARLHDLREQLGLHDLVTFAGSRDQDLLPYYYAAAEMVVMPSHYESFGMVALESMAMGTPVIASEVGGLAHLVRDGYNGYLVPSRDPAALAARILDVLECEGCRRRLGRQALLYAQSF